LPSGQERQLIAAETSPSKIKKFSAASALELLVVAYPLRTIGLQILGTKEGIFTTETKSREARSAGSK
jgi:hypothetical protein